jgi:competence ComEA-like helix-hairpin-helix protein
MNGALATSLCLPPPHPSPKPKETPDDAEKIALQAERDAYKRLYETVLEQFVEVKFNYDLKVRTEEAVFAAEPEEETYVEEQEFEPECFSEPEVEEEPEVEAEFTPEIVNINAASAQEISCKTGLSLKDAYAITGYRKKNGLFVELEELLEVSRISKPKFERIKEWCTLGESEPEELIEEPTKEEENEPSVEIAAEKVNVNDANIYELMRAGFGKSEAGRIVRWVKKYGSFKSLDELTKVDGVTGKLLRKIRDGLEV